MRPGDTGALAAVVAAATGAGHAVIPRGGGMSYSGGYLAVEDDSIVVDMRRMNRVIHIDRDDMYVTVECGCTWKALHEALEGTGLRTPFWGTLSGISATVGGGMSQNGIFWGSGRHGTAVESLLSLKVVLADGRILDTGAAAQHNGVPFFRHYGPDLTGLFAADTGALGFKATATLRLVPEPQERRFASFDFPGVEAIVPAMSAIARAGVAAECFGFDPFLQQQRMQRESVIKDVKALAGVLKSSGSIGRALRDGASVALSGRSYMKDVSHSLHLIFEERTGQAADAALEEARSICAHHDGREIADSIPRILRANPFTPLNNVLGPRGERWVPVHVLVPHSRALAVTAAVEAFFERNAGTIERFDIGVGTSGFEVWGVSRRRFGEPDPQAVPLSGGGSIRQASSKPSQ